MCSVLFEPPPAVRRASAPPRMPRCARRSPRPRRARRRSHGSRHTRARGCLHATPCHTGRGTAASAPAWPSRRAPVGAVRIFSGVTRLTPISSPRLVRAHPEPGLLSSPGITRVHRSYEPLRLLPDPPPERSRCQVTLTARQVSRVANHTRAYVLRPLPRRAGPPSHVGGSESSSAAFVYARETRRSH